FFRTGLNENSDFFLSNYYLHHKTRLTMKYISTKSARLLAVLAGVLISFSTLAALPRVKILATGGTIAGAGTSAERAGYQAGALPIDELLNAVPQIHKIAKVTGEQISSVGSQDITVVIWQTLAVRI